MALQVTGLKRQFIIEVDGKKITLEDPNPSMSPDEVRKLYAGKYPHITTSAIEGPKVKDSDTAVYTFGTKVGTKG